MICPISVVRRSSIVFGLVWVGLIVACMIGGWSLAAKAKPGSNGRGTELKKSEADSRKAATVSKEVILAPIAGEHLHETSPFIFAEVD